MLWDPVWLALQVNILNLRPVIQSQWISVVKQCCKSMISKPVCEGKVYNSCMEALGHNRSAQEEEYWRGSLSHWNTWLHFSHCFVGLQCLNMNSPGHFDAEEMHLHHPSSTSPSPQHKQGKHREAKWPTQCRKEELPEMCQSEAESTNSLQKGFCQQVLWVERTSGSCY